MRFPADWTIEDQQEWLEDYARAWYERYKPTSKVPAVFEEALEEAHKKLEGKND